MRKLFFLFMFAWIALGMNAQRVVREAPPSYAYQQVAKAELQSTQKLVIPFKVDALLAEDAKLEGLGFPLRVAKTISAKFTPETAGEWTTLPDGKRIWRLEIDAADANSISLLYDKFIIPNGSKLFIYDVDYNVVNVYTSLDNPKRQEYSTDFIPGDKIRLEYVASVETVAPQIVISGVSYAYKDVIASLEAKSREAIGGMEPRGPGREGFSDACEVNVNCSEGENWYNQKRGVASTIQVLSDGSYLCSGTVINTALQDRTPYFLMAYHCGGEATAAQFNQWRFYFFWEREGCENTSPLKDYKLITGATLKVGIPLDGASDGLLLQLNQTIPEEWEVFYNGWDRRNVATAGGVGIHHPNGDVKKISTYTQIPTNATANMNTGEVGATNAHWSFIWAATEHGYGVTEGGSSGSPLFNSEKRVIGTLTGGSSTCSNLTGNNIYGKMSWHWDQSPDPNLRMAKYLDPNNSGIEFVDGTYGDPYKVVFTASQTSIWASEEIKFINHSYGDIDTYEWDFGANAVPATYVGQNPPAPILYNVEGDYVVKLTAKKEGNIVDIFSLPIKVTLKQNYCPTSIAIGDAASGTTAAFPLGMSPGGNNRHSLSASIYTAAELGFTSAGQITDLEWTANTAVATSRTLYVYLKEVDESGFSAGTTWANEIAGATLAYQATLSNNPVGAVKIHLTTPFTYSGAKNLKVLVRASTTTNVATNSACTYTATATNTHQEWAVSTGNNPPTNAGTPNANRPNITFYYNEACGANQPVADFSLSASTINQGESVTITDLSTGPVVTYKWSFPGGIPSSSNEAAPTVRYMTAGVYDISLEVKNTEGTDSKMVTGAVTVNVHVPEVDFASYSDGFIKASDFGPFLPPTGGNVEFEGLLQHYPTSIEWSFSGATPASSTEEYPEVNYPAGVAKYDVSLSASNAAGTGDKSKPDYVQVGGTAEVWNVMQGEEPVWRYNYSGYAITGASIIFSKASERLEAPAGGEVSKVRIYTSNVTQNANGYMTVQLFSDKGGLPGTAISEEKRIQGGSNRIANGGYNTITFDQPVPVSGAFHVVVGTTSTTYVNYSVLSVEGRANGYNTVCIYSPGLLLASGWYELSNVFNLATSLNIIPEFTYTSAELTSPFAFNKKNIDSAAETISFTTDGHLWTATADKWINLSAASGSVTSGNGSLTFTVKENTKQMLRKGTIKLNVAGNELKIYVTQAGAAPVDVMAEYQEEKDGIQVDWTHDLYKPGDNIFDDAEDYPSFMKAPQGYYPWTFIDGDKAKTFLISGFAFDGMGDPLSFIAFDATGLSSSYQAHSGNMYFASIGASGKPSDDWMISPKLAFEEDFTLSFWAKSLTNTYNGGERFRVVYSTGGKTQAEFTNVLSPDPYVVPPTTWKNYSYTVPADAKYVAINCVSDDEFIFMVDDIFIGTGMAPASTPVTIANLPALKASGNYVKVKPETESMVAEKIKNIDKAQVQAEQLNVIGVSEKTQNLASATLSDKRNFGKKSFAIHPDDLTLSSINLKQSNVLRASAEEDDEEIALQWYNTPAYIYGHPDGGHIEVAIRFTPEDLVFYDQATLKAVEIYLYRPCENVTINIRQGNQIVSSQPLGNITQNLLRQRIALNTPVVIDATKDLYIGYEYDQYPGDAQDVYVAIFDNGPAVAGKGNLYSRNGSPLHAEPSGNWIITGYLEPAKVNITFNVYRDGDLISEGVTEKTYVDTAKLSQATQFCYTVTAVYNNPELESTESDPPACTYSPIIIKAKDDAATEFCVGESVILFGPEINTCTYTWFKDGEEIEGETGNSITVTQSGAYRLQVLLDGEIEVPGSNTINVTVFQLPSTPSIVYQEETADNAIFSIVDPQAGVQYQWYSNAAPVGGLTTNTTYSASGVPGNYYVVAINGNGCESGESNPLNFTIITITADGHSTFCDGGNVRLFATRESGYAYQWYKNEVAIQGETTSSYIATTTGLYAVQVMTEGRTLPMSNPVSVVVYPAPSATPVISASVTQTINGEPATISVNTPESGILYQWYKGTTALGAPSANSSYSVEETGVYSVIAVSQGGCSSEKSNEVSIMVIDPLVLFSVSTDSIFPAGDGSTSHEVIVSISDPNNYISTLGLHLYVNAPEWITVTVNGNSITFVATSNITGALRTGTIQVWYGTDNSTRSTNATYNPKSGYEIKVRQKAIQTILFEAPEFLLLETGVYNLEAMAGNGVNVIYSLRPEDSEFAEIKDGKTLILKKEGTIIVTASAPGNDIFEDADNVSITIEIRKGTGIDKIGSNNLTVYPNPVRAGAKFYITSSLDEGKLKDAYIEVYSTQGSLIRKVKVTGKITEMNLPITGTYILRLKGEEFMIIIK